MFVLHLEGRRGAKKVVLVVIVFGLGAQKCKTSKEIDFLGSLSPQKMGLGGVEVALPATPGNCGAAFCENTHGDG